MQPADLLLVLLAIFFPPAAALVVSGCGCDLLVNLLLTCLAYVPGVLHALYLIFKKSKAEERLAKSQFVYVGNGQYQPDPHAHPGQPPYGSHQAPYAPGQGQPYVQTSGMKQ